MFYENYVKLCNSINKKPSAVALEIGISKSIVSRWKNGGGLTDATAQKVAEYFGISVEELLGENKQKEKPANDNVDELHLTENEVKLILWLRSLPPEMREAVLNIPTGSGTPDNQQE